MDGSTPIAPAHVPPELFWNYSMEDFLHEMDDPFLAAARLHDGPDVVWSPGVVLQLPGWVLTRHALIQEAFLDHEHFGNMAGNDSGGTALAEYSSLASGFRLVPLMYDPPQHTAYRHILNPFFMPRAMNVLEASVREICDSLVAPFAQRGSCEFISEFATYFPTRVFLALMGLPQANERQFLDWEHGLMRGEDFAERSGAMAGMLGYLSGFLAEQRANPQTDLIKGILAGRVFEGRSLTDMEILGMLALLYIGGLDTVHSALGWFMRHLATDPALQTRLRENPDDIPRAIEELMRAYGITATHRRVTKDFEFHGVQMRKGDMVLLPSYLASRDPRAYENPHKVDIDRQARHLFFGSGAHHCLGQHLARREIKIVFETMLAQCENIHIPAGETVAFHTGSTFGVDKLPLAWTPRSP